MTNEKQWTILSPVPENRLSLPKTVGEKVQGKWVNYDIQFHWAYRDQLGNLLGYVIRYETPAGKQVVPLAFCKDENGKNKWKRKAWWGDKRPMFHLDKLAHSPNAQVIIVEGEKCAEALQGIIEGAGASGNLVAISWSGGSKAVDKTDWSPVAGRTIVLWPDADNPGHDCMVKLSGIIKGRLKLLDIPEDKPQKWDVADAIHDGWVLPDILSFIKSNLIDPPETLPEPDPEPAPDEQQQQPIDISTYEPERWPFKCLGYSGNYYYYLPSGTRQVRIIAGEGHGQAAFLTLAPLHFWEREFGGNKGVDWKLAANSLLRICEKKKVYNTLKQRGRGAWYDDKRAVLHLGDRLIVNGSETRIEEIESRYIYEAGPELEYTHAQPLPTVESVKLKQITDMLKWERSIHSIYMAGWCVIAPISGCLKCRPHIWLTGAAGSGKTHVIDNIIKPCLGEFPLNTTTPTTAAGVRQALGCDALPVLCDEFEAIDFSSDKRVQDLLELARQAFSDSSAHIFKGSANGRATAFQTRSCFFFSSITVSLHLQSDKTRVNVASLQVPHDTAYQTSKEHFTELQKFTNETLTPEWCASLRARTIQLIPVIRDNAETFAQVLAERLGNRRAGDQVAALVAGAYSLYSGSKISYEAACEWCDKQDWSEQKSIVDESDERKCLQAIMSAIVKNGASEISIAELLLSLQENTEYNSLTSGMELSALLDHDKVLRRHGIRYDKDDALIWISDSHPGLRKLLEKTAWQKSSARLLKRIPGTTNKPMRFLGTLTRASGIPWCEAFSEN